MEPEDRRLHRDSCLECNTRVLSREELRRVQRLGRGQALMALAMMCRERWLRAARLLGVRGVTVRQLQDFGLGGRVDLEPLWPAWEAMCRCFDPSVVQLSLFPGPESDSEREWWRHVYHDVFPTLVDDDRVVRSVLRALGVLPCAEPDLSADVVRRCVEGFVRYDPDWLDYTEEFYNP